MSPTTSNGLSTAGPASILQVNEMLGVEIPLPALERGWLHSRELIVAWDVERIVEKIGAGCWFSHYCRAKTDVDGPVPTELPRLRPYSLAGFWPTGGLVELRLNLSNPLDDLPRGTLCVHAASAAEADALISELFTHYRLTEPAGTSQPRIGLLNYAYDSLAVERVPVTAAQIVPRSRLELYYGEGAGAWADEWIETLQRRRYGLTVLTGAPGTGKTTLLRSLAHWLAESHVCYFMPAARFASVESGEIVTFWADENRNSRLRKLLILEDAESILLRRADDNREKVATLLNLTDGMLGDALGLHVVCTLNCSMLELDPALLRPGRLVAHRDFPPLDDGQARRLAAALGLPEPAFAPISLAELLNGTAPAHSPARLPLPSPERRTMGFHTVLTRTTARADSNLTQ